MLDDAAVFLLRAGQKSRNIFESNQWDVEGVAEAHKARAFHRRVDVQRPGEDRRLIGNDADGTSVQACETNDDILGKMLVDFKEVAFIDDGVNHILNIVRLLWILGDDAVEGLFAAVDGVMRGTARWIFKIVAGQETEKLADHRATFRVITRNKVSDSTRGIVGHGAAEFLLGDFLVRDILDDVRAGDEHVGSVVRHQDEIGDGGGVDGAAGTGSKDRADLRDHAAGESIAEKNVRVAGKGCDAFLNARSAGIVQANDGSAIAHGQIH